MQRQFIWGILLIVGLIGFSPDLTAQKAQLKIIDEETSEACAFANVVLYDKNNNYIKGAVTDGNGFVEFDITEKTKVKVSFVGYISHTGFISPGDNKTIKLKVDFVGMEEVVVTGQYKPRKVDQSIYKIDVINSKTLLERGVTNLAEALSNETGIRLTVDPSTGTSIIMQGMGGENVKYLIDGVPIVGRVNGDIDLSQINMENVDHIEIVQGPMSVVYGTSALAGVINIITKQNTKDKNIVKANSYTDNKGNYNVGIYSSLIRGKHSVTLSGNRDLFQGIDTDLNPNDTTKHIIDAYGEGKDRYMEFKPKRVINADIEYAYRNEYFQIRAKTQYMNLLLKSYNNPSPVLIAYDADYYTTRLTNSLTISNKISEALSFNIVGAYTYYGRNTDYISSDLVSLDKVKTGSSFTVFHNGMTRGNFTYAKEESKLSYQFGWDINYDSGEGDKIADSAQIADLAGFVSAQFVPFKQLSIQPGFRYIYNTIYPAPVIPSINLQWTIVKGLGFRVSYAKGFRAPSLKELYLDFKDSNHNLEGNKDLKAEKTDSYNASISYKVGKKKHLLKIEPSVFYNDGKDAITLIVTDIESSSATNTNMGGRRTFGGNINASYMHFIGLSLSAGYSRTGRTYDYTGNGDYAPIVFYDNYTFNAKYNWRKHKTIFMANLKYYGETPSLSVDKNTLEYYQVYTDPFGEVEATVSKLFWKNRLTVILGGKNLLNNYSSRTYGYRYDYDERYGPKNYGRTFFVKLNLKLNN
ncbi:MAG: TonB-dependent receptor [Bacteroidota bacterium]